MKDVNIINRMFFLIISVGYNGSDYCRKNQYVYIFFIILLFVYCLNDKGRVIKMRVYIIEYKFFEL